MTPTELLALAREIRDVNAKNGADILVESDLKEKPDKVLAKLAMIHYDISEFFDEANDDECMKRLADIQIRILETMGATTDLGVVNAFKSFEISDYALGIIRGTCRSDLVGELHAHVSRALEAYKTHTACQDEIFNQLALIFHVINNKYGGNRLTEAFNAKLARNRERNKRL